MNIRQVVDADAPSMVAIYNWYVEHTIITFETQAVSVEEMQARIADKLVKHDWIVGELDGELVGYAYYGTFRPRHAYAHTVESTVYLAQQHVGKGYGRKLYTELIASAQARGYRELIGIIALPNPASILLHRRVGFEEVGILKQAGYKLGRYIDVAIWQKSVRNC